jgi:lauroyl/myristoyl acyltransferase
MHCSIVSIEQYICTNDDDEKIRRIFLEKIRILRMIPPVDWYIIRDVSAEHAASVFRLHQSNHSRICTNLSTCFSTTRPKIRKRKSF